MQFQSFTAEYVQHLMDGDPETERHFISYFRKLLMIKVGHRLGSRYPVDDVYQEIFFRVFSALKRKALTAPESLGAFVNGVCNNVLAEYYRSASRQPSRLEDGGDPLSRDPEQELEAAERKQYVHVVLNSLSPKDRDILRLIFLEERNKNEVCRICHVDRTYLRVLIHRAKKRFRRHIPPESPELSDALD